MTAQRTLRVVPPVPTEFYVPDALARSFERSGRDEKPLRLVSSSLHVVEGGGAHACRYRPTARDVAREQRMGVRDVVAAVLVAIAFCAFAATWLGHVAESSASAQVGVGYERVVVQEGESLWTLAEDHPVAGMTTREVVDLVSSHNGLTSSVLQPGQAIMMPTTAGADA